MTALLSALRARLEKLCAPFTAHNHSAGNIITPEQCFERYGVPDVYFERKWMVPYIPHELILQHIPALPRRIYCNKEIVHPLTLALINIISNGLSHELKTWDGCFNIRTQRGSNRASLHSWGIAIDLNAAWNRFGATPTLSDAFVRCFESAGFTWGGRWRTADGMHFQITYFPSLTP